MRSKAQKLGKVPSYVIDFRRTSNRVTSKHTWIVRHLLPAGSAVRALFKYFRKGIRAEKEIQGLCHRPRMEPDWYAEWWPTHYLPIMETEARHRAYSYLLVALRKHAKMLSKVWRPERWRDPRRRFNAWSRHSKALDALEAVGAWWLDADRSMCPWRSRAERKALELCARIRRLQVKAIEGLRMMSTKNFTAALDWMSQGIEEDLRKGRRAKKARKSAGENRKGGSMDKS